MSRTPGDSSRRLVLVRHGRTAWNAIGRGQGHTDVELDDVGHEQARAAAPRLATYQPSLLWSSDLARARQTAAYVAKETGLDPEYDARLREFDLGERTGLTMDEYATTFPEEYAAFRAGVFKAVPGAETAQDVRRRVAPALSAFLAVLDGGRTGMLISHGTALRVAIAHLLGWPGETMNDLSGMTNCGWVVLDEAREGRFRLAAYNLTA